MNDFFRTGYKGPKKPLKRDLRASEEFYAAMAGLKLCSKCRKPNDKLICINCAFPITKS